MNPGGPGRDGQYPGGPRYGGSRGGSHGGTYYHGGGHRGGPYHGGYHGGYHHGGPYYGGYYGYSPYSYAGWGYPYWGWPYWSASWGWGWDWPYWGAGYPGYTWGTGYDGAVVYANGFGRPPMDRYAAVKTDISPEEAELFLDGQYVGRADDFDGFPDYLYLERGVYRLEFRHPTYLTLVRDVDAQPGQQIKLDAQMALAPGKTPLDSFDPPDRGTPLGRAFGKDGTQLKPAVGEAPVGEELPPSGSTVPQSVDRIPPAPRDDARLSFNVTPADAVVYLDDEYLGPADELAEEGSGIPVRSGRHAVTVVRPGYRAMTVDVESSPGQAAAVKVDLVR